MGSRKREYATPSMYTPTHTAKKEVIVSSFGLKGILFMLQSKKNKNKLQSKYFWFHLCCLFRKLIFLKSLAQYLFFNYTSFLFILALKITWRYVYGRTAWISKLLKAPKLSHFKIMFIKSLECPKKLFFSQINANVIINIDMLSIHVFSLSKIWFVTTVKDLMPLNAMNIISVAFATPTTINHCYYCCHLKPLILYRLLMIYLYH